MYLSYFTNLDMLVKLSYYWICRLYIFTKFRQFSWKQPTNIAGMAVVQSILNLKLPCKINLRSLTFFSERMAMWYEKDMSEYFLCFMSILSYVYRFLRVLVSIHFLFAHFEYEVIDEINLRSVNFFCNNGSVIWKTCRCISCVVRVVWFHIVQIFLRAIVSVYTFSMLLRGYLYLFVCFFLLGSVCVGTCKIEFLATIFTENEKKKIQQNDRIERNLDLCPFGAMWLQLACIVNKLFKIDEDYREVYILYQIPWIIWHAKWNQAWKVDF